MTDRDAQVEAALTRLMLLERLLEGHAGRIQSHMEAIERHTHAINDVVEQASAIARQFGIKGAL
jgi:hypothetical protein